MKHRVSYVRSSIVLLLVALTYGAPPCAANASGKRVGSPAFHSMHHPADAANAEGEAANSERGGGNSPIDAEPARNFDLAAIFTSEVRFNATGHVLIARRPRTSHLASGRLSLALCIRRPLYAPPLEILFCTWQL